MHAKALRNINLVDKNYALKNDLAVIQDQMASILAQNQLLQEQLSTTQTQTNCTLPVPPNEDRMDDNAPAPIRGGSINMREQDGAESLGSALDHGYLGLVCPVNSSMEEDEPMQICGGGDHAPKANTMRTKMTVGMNCQEQAALSQMQAPLAPAPCALLPLGEIQLLYPPSFVQYAGSYYLCPVDVSGGPDLPSPWVQPNNPKAGALLCLEAMVGDLQDCFGHHAMSGT
jgi:hypothetical protein